MIGVRTTMDVAGGAVAACLLVLGSSGTCAQSPEKPVLLSTTPVEPEAGLELGFPVRLALHGDGTALVVSTQERDEAGSRRYRVLALSVAPDGKVARSTTLPETADIVAGLGLAAEADGFALATVLAPGRVTLQRLARDGSVRAKQALALRPPLNELAGIAADGRGKVIVFGGVDEGPHAPGMALADGAGRVLWYFAGKHPMPPGGVMAARFRRDGGNDAVVIDREKPSWERRAANGAVLRRAALPRHWNQWAFLDENRLATVFYNWEEGPIAKAPTKRWLLALIGPDGRFRPEPVVLDLPGDQNVYSRLAVNDAGWIAVTLGAGKIALFDAAPKLRAEIDLAPHGATAVETLAVDAKGAVTALVDTRPADQPARKLVLLRFAPAAP